MLYRIAAAILVPSVIVIIWYLGTLTSTNPYVPKPVQIVVDLVQVWIGPVLGDALAVSLYRLGAGLALAIVIGVLLGLLIGSSRVARKITGPLFEFVRAVPPPVLLPVLLLLFGIGDSPKIFLIFLGCLWPILLNTVDGVRSVDMVLADTTRSYAISGWSRFRYFVLPAAMPRIMTGIRLAIPISIILMVVSELYGAFDGLGAQINMFKQIFQIGPMWAGILIIGIIGLLLSAVFRLIERRVLAWYFGQREVETHES